MVFPVLLALNRYSNVLGPEVQQRQKSMFKAQSKLTIIYIYVEPKNCINCTNNSQDSDQYSQCSNHIKLSKTRTMSLISMDLNHTPNYQGFEP